MLKKILLINAFILATSVAFANSPSVSIVAEETMILVQDNQSKLVVAPIYQSGSLSCGISYYTTGDNQQEIRQSVNELDCLACGSCEEYMKDVVKQLYPLLN